MKNLEDCTHYFRSQSSHDYSQQVVLLQQSHPPKSNRYFSIPIIFFGIIIPRGLSNWFKFLNKRSHDWTNVDNFQFDPLGICTFLCVCQKVIIGKNVETKMEKARFHYENMITHFDLILPYHFFVIVLASHWCYCFYWFWLLQRDAHSTNFTV